MNKIVIIDAGHGGYDPGAVGKQTTEKALTLQMTHRTVSKLLTAGIDARMTRDKDVSVWGLTDKNSELTARSTISNNAKADAFVSIHMNSSTSALANGTEVYYKESKDLPLAKKIYPHLLKATGFGDRGVKYGNLSVIRKTHAPAILCEIGFISNAKEEAAMMGSLLQERVADAITQGVCEFLGVNATPAYELRAMDGHRMDAEGDLRERDGSVYIAARKFGAWYGAKIDFDMALQKVLLNGSSIKTLIINGVGYIPIREAAERIGLSVVADAKQRTIVVVRN